jgi:hypothetical protein
VGSLVTLRAVNARLQYKKRSQESLNVTPALWFEQMRGLVLHWQELHFAYWEDDTKDLSYFRQEVVANEVNKFFSGELAVSFTANETQVVIKGLMKRLYEKAYWHVQRL